MTGPKSQPRWFGLADVEFLIHTRLHGSIVRAEPALALLTIAILATNHGIGESIGMLGVFRTVLVCVSGCLR